MDLGAMANYCYHVRVWEQPRNQPHWAQIFGWLPAVAIETLFPSSGGSSIHRCTLVMTIAGLERRIGRFVRRGDLSWTFESENVQIHLRGFNEASLSEARKAGKIVKEWRWTGSSARVVIPERRFGGQQPSQLNVICSHWPEAAWLPIRMVSSFIGITQSSNGTVVKEVMSLGQLIHGCDIGGDQLGLMIECI